MNRICKSLVTLLILAGGANFAHAVGTTYYFGIGGNDASGTGSSGNPYFTSTRAFTNGGANVYIMKVGTYTTPEVVFSSVPAGTPSHYTMIKCETEGKCIITYFNSLVLDVNCRNAEWHGFRWNYTGHKEITGTNLKFFRCAFQGGLFTDAGHDPGGLVIGRGSEASHNVLLEDCWVYGAGSRYNMALYNANKTILRRVASRHEGGWDDEGTGDPEANFVIYNSSQTSIQNCVAFDSSGTYDTYVGAYYLVYNSNPTSMVHNNTEILGSVSLNIRGSGYRLDSALHVASSTFRNIVAWDNTDFGFIGGSGSQDTNVHAENFTFGAGTAAPALIGLGNYGSGGSKTFLNGIITGFGDDLDGSISATYVDEFNNGAEGVGTGKQTYNPRTNGLKYLTRIEDGSNLANDGNNGRMGATIVKRIGCDGCAWEDPGSRALTSTDLWPWPYQDRMTGDFCVGISTGLCDPNKANGDWDNYIVGMTALFQSPYSSTVAPSFCTSLVSSFTAVNQTSFTVNYTSVTNNYIVVMATVSDFSAVMSSAQFTGVTTTYLNLSAGQWHYAKVKIATETDCGYTSAISTLTLTTALISSFTQVNPQNFTVSYTSAGPAYSAVVAADSAFTSIVSSGIVAGPPQLFQSLAPSTPYWFQVKVATEAGGYRTSITTTTLAISAAGAAQNITLRGLKLFGLGVFKR